MVVKHLLTERMNGGFSHALLTFHAAYRIPTRIRCCAAWARRGSCLPAARSLSGCFLVSYFPAIERSCESYFTGMSTRSEATVGKLMEFKIFDVLSPLCAVPSSSFVCLQDSLFSRYLKHLTRLFNSVITRLLFASFFFTNILWVLFLC